MLFVLSVLWSVVSLLYLVLGRSIEPKALRAVDEASAVSPDLGHFVRALLRLVGLNWLTSGILAATIAATGLRRGEMWAWYVWWAIVAYWFGDSTIDRVAGGSGWRRGYAWSSLIAGALLLCPQAGALRNAVLTRLSLPRRALAVLPATELGASQSIADGVNRELVVQQVSP
jgi:hypothetical protein